MSSAKRNSDLEVFAKQTSLAILPDRLFQLSATALYGFAHDIEAPWTHIKRVLEFTKLRFYGEINERQSQELEQALLRVREVKGPSHDCMLCPISSPTRWSPNGKSSRPLIR